MFRSKRSSLVKRLWKLRAAQNETKGTPEKESAEDLEVKSVVQSMLKRLKESQLEMLLHALESKGGETTECVLLPKGELRMGKRIVSPHVLCCQLFRWPSELHSESQMKRLPCCSTLASDPSYVCCNPHHWSLILDPEFPPIDTGLCDDGVEDLPFQRVPKSSGGPALHDPVSTETGLTPTHRREDSFEDETSFLMATSPGLHSCCGNTGAGEGEGCLDSDHHHHPLYHGHPCQHVHQHLHHHHHWCSIAYWELRQRVGRLYAVRDPTLNVFQRLPHGSGMCLQLLQSESDLESVCKTREKIGFGISLSREGRSVWAYNRSQFPIFVNSPTLEEANCKTLVVWKVLPGFSIRLFDYDRLEALERTRDPELADGPYDPYSVRVSFAKGWGPCYARQFVTSCPCWLEIFLKELNR